MLNKSSSQIGKYNLLFIERPQQIEEENHSLTTQQMVRIEAKPMETKKGIDMHPGFQAHNLCSSQFAIMTFHVATWNFHVIYEHDFFSSFFQTFLSLYCTHILQVHFFITDHETEIFINCSLLFLPEHSVAGILHFTSFVLARYSHSCLLLLIVCAIFTFPIWYMILISSNTLSEKGTLPLFLRTTLLI